MSVAVIQGSSGGIGLALTSHILRNTSLKVYALTHGKASSLKEKLGEQAKDDGRLIILGDVDVREEGGLESAAKTVKEREGSGSVRLVTCLAGILRQEKSLSSFEYAPALDSFRINTLGHLLTYKHFVPLIPTGKQLKDAKAKWDEGGDPAHGLIAGDISLCWSNSARVGSIADNEKGGWYSYRSSKAALNQVIRCLDHELVNKSSSAVAVAYHPGTVLTDFAKPVVGQNAKPTPDSGRFSIDQAIEHLTTVMGQVRREEKWGGKFFDWAGKRVEW